MKLLIKKRSPSAATERARKKSSYRKCNRKEGRNQVNDVQIFNSEEFGQVRTVEINGTPWFVGKDVADALGYKNTRDALINHVDADDKDGVEIPDAMGRNQCMAVINESGVYGLILSSKLPTAKRFKHWVTSEVLPSIRKTGGYNLPQTYAEALRALADKAEEAERLAIENAEMKPKAVFADAVSVSEHAILIRDMAKLIKQNGVDIGEKRFYRWLREHGYICKSDCTPTQRAMELGLFEVEVKTVNRGVDYLPLETRTTKVTGKGQIYFINKFLNA